MPAPARLVPVVPAAFALFAACSDAVHGPGDPGLANANPALGRQAFEQACASCHASNDGFDLKMFGFTDTTIIRRAVHHVDSATARDIVAYIRGVQAPSRDESTRLFQPRGAPLSSDVEFATTLFGRDEWPADLTTATLAAIDPRNVRVAVRLPVWSDEQSNLDWMPDFVLPPGVLDYSGGLARGAIAGYNAAPTGDNLVRAVNALRNADRAAANTGAPCLLDDSLRVRYRECFEVRRWTSTLVALHMLRNGVDVPLAGRVQDVWWDVGNVARRSRAARSIPIANPVENWATWMFLGWSFDPSRHASVYTGGGFRQLGLTRHATFVALRSQVARPRNSVSVYDDILNAVRFAPPGWTASVAAFGLRHAEERLAAGDRPQSADQIAMAVTAVNTTVTEANRKIPVADRGAIAASAQRVLEALSR
jgi:hypothetical protein